MSFEDIYRRLSQEVDSQIKQEENARREQKERDRIQF